MKDSLRLCVFYTFTVAKVFGKRWTAGSWTHIPSELHFKGHRETFSPLWKQMRMASRRLRLFQDQQ